MSNFAIYVAHCRLDPNMIAEDQNEEDRVKGSSYKSNT